MTLQILKSGRYRSRTYLGGVWIMERVDSMGRESAVAVSREDGSGTVMADGENARFIDLKRVVGKEE
jgi:hypothetical protein